VSAWLLAARLVLAAVFLISGLAKAADLSGTRQAVEGFGFPAWTARPAALALPGVELGLAAALLAASSAGPAGWAALGLLAVFSVVVTISLARGRRPTCHCFGQLHAAPVSWRTLARNLALAAVATFVALGGPPHGGASLGGVGSSPAATAVVIAALAIALVTLGALVVVLLGRYGEVLRRLDELQGSPGASAASAAGPHQAGGHPSAGLPVGSQAPEFELAGLNGEPVTLSGLRSAGRPVLLLFGDPGCEPCRSLLPELAHWQAEYAGQFTAALISRGSVAANLAESVAHHIGNVAIQRDREIASSYRYSGTPSAVIVSPDGRVASPVAGGQDAIRSLVATLLWEAAPNRAVPVPAQPVPAQPVPAQPPPSPLRGQPAPTASLPNLDGELTALSAPSERSFMVFFWNPACGFCQQVLGDVKARERGPVDFVFVSTGEVPANRAMGLSSPILLDPSFATARAFGASGTPCAVLVGADGRVASELAVGGPAVLSLADEAVSAAMTSARPG
jgi:thiol-disulfide isomerase/thioredoxin/uncharacterized membrane protein YphA (DoxX/SURF4 family)